jgi:hypothetical protein
MLRILSTSKESKRKLKGKASHPEDEKEEELEVQTTLDNYL